MNKASMINYINNKYNFDILPCMFTVKELKTFINFDKNGYKIEKITKDNYNNGIRFNYGFIAIK